MLALLSLLIACAAPKEGGESAAPLGETADTTDRESTADSGTDTPTDTGEGDWYTIYATGFSDEYLARLSQNPNNPIGRFTTVEVVARKLASQFQVQAALSIYAKPHP